MALDPNPPGRPDFAAREPSTGKAVIRPGGEATESDVDIGTSDNPVNIGTDGDDYESGERATGGASEISVTIVSDQSNTFDVHFDWLDDSGNVLRTESPSALQGVSDVDEGTIIAKSDHFELRVVDASGAATNEIHGSANSH